MSAFMSSNPEHDDGIPWEQSLEWIIDTALKLPADHPARTPDLINSAVIEGEHYMPTKVELWCEDNPHHEQPAAYLWTQDPETGELVEDTNERLKVNGGLYVGSEIHMRSSKYPEILFAVTLSADDFNEPPWDRSEGHGPVRMINSERERKRPGERPLWEERHTTWLYDWQAACKLARKDGWNARPYDAPKRVERAVNADYDFLRSYLCGDWGYVVVKVEALKDEESLGDDVLGGVKTNDNAYLLKTLSECASSIAGVEDLPARIKRMHAERAEATERAYWEARDVVTNG